MKVAVVLLSVSFLGFTLISSSQPDQQGWPYEDTVKVRMNFSNCGVAQSEMQSNLQDAIDLWNSIATCGLELEYAGETTATAAQASALSHPETDGPIVTCDAAFTPDEDVVAGVGSVSINGELVIVKGSIVLNANPAGAARMDSFDAVGRSSVIAHELGHTIGLGHSPDNRALMYFSVGRSSLNLGLDDANGCSYLYPREELGGSGIFGCASMAYLSRRSKSPPAQGPSGSGTGPIQFLGLMLALAFGARAMRRSSIAAR